MAALPSPRHLVAILISSISETDSSTATVNSAPTSNPLKDATPSTQKALLTLHVLFPNELLPALDLLDRELITRFILPEHYSNLDEHDQQPGRKEVGVYYVRSAQPQSQSRHRSALSHSHHTTSYEVRLNSWSCSCPAFAFAAFPVDPGTPSTSSPELLGPGDDGGGNGSADWSFGGRTRGTDMPVCKHLLACVLVERSEMFASFTEEREVSVEELAGWAAGWGD